MASTVMKCRRPSIFLMGLLVLGAYSVQMQVSGYPSPYPLDASDADFQGAVDTTVQSVKTTWEKIKDFFNRMILTFTGKADESHPGLTPIEIAFVIVGAVLFFMFFFCCIGFFVCACVKEIICCICCCSCCRD